jgi:hypothetical protein
LPVNPRSLEKGAVTLPVLIAVSKTGLDSYMIQRPQQHDSTRKPPMKSAPILFALILSTTALAAEPAAPANPHAGMTMPQTAAPQTTLSQTGKVLSMQSVPGYTYVEVQQGKKTVWLAAVSTTVKKGDVVQFDDGMVMTDFYSKSLKRSFPSIVFVNSLVVANGKK